MSSLSQKTGRWVLGVCAVLAVAGTASAAMDRGAQTPGRERPASTRATPGEAFNDAASIGSLRERALTKLTEAAARGTPEEAANAVEAMIPTPGRLTQAVVSALRDPSAGLRGVAAMSVGKARLAQVSSAVEPLVNDPSPQVRAAAIFALRRLGRSIDPTPLSEMLFDNDPRVRSQAAFVLGELGDPSALPMLSESVRSVPKRTDPSEQRLLELQVAEARVKLGDELALVDVRAALYPARAEDFEAAALAAALLGQLRDRASVNQLIELTRMTDGNKRPMPGEVRLAAAASLAKLGQPFGGPIALEYANNSRDALRAQAAFVFGEIGDTANLGELSRLMEDPVGRVRIAAASAVLRVTDGGRGNP
jgi:HEAT repeat protein